jgi:RNA polymerase sigma-70 factor (ECF subfamily)
VLWNNLELFVSSQAYQVVIESDVCDGDLMEQARAGSEAAFSTLYGRHQGSVYRYALHMCGKAEVAEEVVQDVFLALLRDPFHYDAGRGPLAAYLLGIARKRVQRWFEKARVFETDLDHLPDPGDLSLESARNQLIEQLRRAIFALPPNYREAVVLCDIEELDYAEAAGIQGCAVGTIRSRLHRARALLAARMRAREGCTA